MFLLAHNSRTFFPMHFMKCLKQIFISRKSCYPFNRILSVNWNEPNKSTIIPKIINHQLFIVLPSLILRRVNYPKMDNITELANLVEVQQDSCKQFSESIADLSMEFSESESSSSLEEIDSSIPLEKVPYKEDHYQHSFNISKNYYKHIVDTKGTILQRLCSETKTIIRVSKKKKHVVIIGSIQKRIFHAKHKINKLIENSKNKPPFTHFISVPTNDDEIKNNFVKFKEDVMQSCKTESIEFDERMFQRPEKLHLTISMLHLLDQKDEERAIASLNNCKENIINPILGQNEPIIIELRGLKCMEKDASKAKVLYIDVHEKTGLLNKMADSINDHFVEQGLSRRQNSNVTLHMTVINTLYLQRKVKEAKKNFDARQFLKNYKNTCLGTVKLSTFHISMLTAKSADGYFKPMTKIHL